MRPDVSTLTDALAKSARAFYGRGWLLGTGGNLSAVAGRDPFQLLITASGRHKGELGDDDFLMVDDAGKAISGEGKPSAETLIHLAILEATGAAAVFHTHSVWATLLSEERVDAGHLTIEGYEMLKGLSGVVTHQHVETVPIFKNTQDYLSLLEPLRKWLTAHPETHGILLSGHGLYTWGKDLFEAHRHVEILEFLFEVVGRRKFGGTR